MKNNTPFTCEQEELEGEKDLKMEQKENWIDEFDHKWREMLHHRLYHYSISYYHDRGRDATKEEQDEASEYAYFEMDRLANFIHSIITKERTTDYERSLQDERKRIADWATKYMEQTTMHYGTDKHGIAIEDLLEELK